MISTLFPEKENQPDSQREATSGKMDISQIPLPRDCTFSRPDWLALAPQWFPVAFSHEVKDTPYSTRLLDERVVLYRLSGGKITAARDLCLHRGFPLSMGWIEEDTLVCKYHGLRYNCEGQCVKIPAHPGAAIPPKLRLQTFPVQENMV